MLDLPTLFLLPVAVLASATMAWAIGAGSSGATPFAPAVGANAVSVLRAALLVGVLGLLGATLQGENVSRAIGAELVAGVALPPLGAIVALAIGAGLMLVGIFAGYPIATAFTVTGAIVGVGLALGGDPAWGKYGQIATLWVLTPPFAGGVAYALASALPREDLPETVSLPALAALVGAVLANVEFALLGPPGSAHSIAATLAVFTPWQGLTARLAVTVALAVLLGGLVRRDVRRAGRRALERFLLALGALVAFSAGGSQVGLAIGPLLPALDGFAVPLSLVLLGGGVGILVGSWTGAPRMIKALARDYASLGPRRSISALVPSFVLAQVAILFGVPISFNEIVVSAIVGSGFAVGGTTGTGLAKLARTGAAWLASLGVSLALGFGAVALLGAP